MHIINADQVIVIHDKVINDHEIQGLAPDKSIHAVIDRVRNRIDYGMIKDVYDLAACYACYIAIGHAFNDANKRTAFRTMMVVLQLNDISIEFETIEAGDMIRGVVIGRVNEFGMADWIRRKAVG